MICEIISSGEISMKMNKVLLVMIFVGMMLPFGTMNVNAQTDNSLQKVIDAGKIIIGTEATYAPFEVTAPNGTLIGFDVEIAKVIAKDINVAIEWKDVGFDTLITSLSAGTFDCVIAAMSITPEREAEVDFSRWYFKTDQAILVPIGNPKNINSIADVNASTIKIGVQQGTTSDSYAADSLIASKSGYSSITLAVQALKQGSVDVVLGDYLTLLNANNTNAGEFKIVGTFESEEFGIAVKTGSTALLNRINSVLNTLLGADVNNPTYSDVYWSIYNATKDITATEETTIDGYSNLMIFAAIPLGVIILLRKRKEIA